MIILEFLIEPQIYHFTIYLPNFTNKKKFMLKFRGKTIIDPDKIYNDKYTNF